MASVIIMARSAHHLCALLLCAAAAAAFSGDAAATTTYSFPAFDAATTDAFVVATNSSVLGPASLIILAPPLYPQFNRSEGFLLLSDAVDVWRAGAGGVPAREASFRTSFTLDAGAGAVAFAVLLDRFPPANAAIGIGLRGAGNYTSSANAAGELAAVEVGTVASYGPTDPAVGLNVTVTPNATAPGAARAVWVQYDAGAHRLSVFRRRRRRAQAVPGAPRRAVRPRGAPDHGDRVRRVLRRQGRRHRRRRPGLGADSGQVRRREEGHAVVGNAARRARVGGGGSRRRLRRGVVLQVEAATAARRGAKDIACQLVVTSRPLRREQRSK
ncbi:hypothetical protein ACP4OV_002280 [Aristida adscensionis]